MPDIKEIEKKMKETANSLGWITSQLVQTSTEFFEKMKKYAENKMQEQTLEKAEKTASATKSAASASEEITPQHRTGPSA